ncbi:DNA-deoxyinosine glycosylase [Methanospirillum stamsii]|uniref:DNA-deoxyinosine glycosylase n=1 Tax=Methanospirillum stamsii TaxID=1277351 RepID=A0A2V2MZS0_9EURY|nr:DNA-deoxyinosine glycosylase [Methanospirillum stamsii]PWR71830.1 DNA-deoxyinosine glycosylase [Methanospirillum stamsii]
MTSSYSGLSPLISPASRVLILGSYPSIISLKTGQYYANPRNMFWDIIEDILGISKNLSYKDRISSLMEEKVGLWDVYANCNRPTSSDAKITEPVPNDIKGLLASHHHIKTIFLNGREAEKGFLRFFPDLEIPCRYLPSSSPAHAIPLKEKVKRWMDINQALSEP